MKSMKKYFLITLSLGLILTISILNSCKKEAEPDNDIQSVTDYVKASDAGTEVFNVVNDYGINEEGIKNDLWDSTINVTITPMFPLDSFPKTMVIDFGTTGVLCNDGYLRKGIVTAVFTGRWSPDSALAGTTTTVSFNNYYVNGVQRLGTYTITYNGKPNGGPKYTVVATNAKLIFTNGETISWNSTRTTEWTAGYATPLNLNDDIYYSSGTATGINAKGDGFAVNITTPLKVDMSCVTNITHRGTVTEGVLELIPTGKAKRIVNYGSGTCDRLASVTINGITINFNF
jgi:hypothetical protein